MLARATTSGDGYPNVPLNLTSQLLGVGVVYNTGGRGTTVATAASTSSAAANNDSVAATDHDLPSPPCATFCGYLVFCIAEADQMQFMVEATQAFVDATTATAASTLTSALPASGGDASKLSFMPQKQQFILCTQEMTAQSISALNADDRFIGAVTARVNVDDMISNVSKINKSCTGTVVENGTFSIAASGKQRICKQQQQQKQHNCGNNSCNSSISGSSKRSSISGHSNNSSRSSSSSDSDTENEKASKPVIVCHGWGKPCFGIGTGTGAGMGMRTETAVQNTAYVASSHNAPSNTTTATTTRSIVGRRSSHDGTDKYGVFRSHTTQSTSSSSSTSASPVPIADISCNSSSSATVHNDLATSSTTPRFQNIFDINERAGRMTVYSSVVTSTTISLSDPKSRQHIYEQRRLEAKAAATAAATDETKHSPNKMSRLRSHSGYGTRHASQTPSPQKRRRNMHSDLSVAVAVSAAVHAAPGGGGGGDSSSRRRATDSKEIEKRLLHTLAASSSSKPTVATASTSSITATTAASVVATATNSPAANDTAASSSQDTRADTDIASTPRYKNINELTASLKQKLRILHKNSSSSVASLGFDSTSSAAAATATTTAAASCSFSSRVCTSGESGNIEREEETATPISRSSSSPSVIVATAASDARVYGDTAKEVQLVADNKEVGAHWSEPVVTATAASTHRAPPHSMPTLSSRSCTVHRGDIITLDVQSGAIYIGALLPVLPA